MLFKCVEPLYSLIISDHNPWIWVKGYTSIHIREQISLDTLFPCLLIIKNNNVNICEMVLDDTRDKYEWCEDT
jgi:hypothetical protein